MKYIGKHRLFRDPKWNIIVKSIESKVRGTRWQLISSDNDKFFEGIPHLKYYLYGQYGNIRCGLLITPKELRYEYTAIDENREPKQGDDFNTLSFTIGNKISNIKMPTDKIGVAEIFDEMKTNNLLKQETLYV